MYKISRRNFIRTSIVLGAGLSLGLTGCSSGEDAQTTAKFGILSDPHVYDQSLGTSGEAFEAYLSNDRKMLVESVEILEAMVNELIKVKDLNFLLIPGDLTKDGEKISHQKMASILSKLTDKGISVYVIPGNHDINNPHAMSFSGSTSTKVASVTPEEFKSIYSNFGYSSAIYKDSNSLSYIAEVADNVWLFAIDSCKYAHNDIEPVTSGAISSATLSWINDKLALAKTQKILCIGMMHHGIIPHFAAQPSLFSEYVLDNYAVVGETLANAGLNIVFTGHFHAQDIVKSTFKNSTLYDVETGSGVTAPSPYRVIDLDIVNKKFDIASYEVHSIPSKADFDKYKSDFISQGMTELYAKLGPAYGMPASLAPIGAEVHIAHYKGDEHFAGLSQTSRSTIEYLMSSNDPATKQLGYTFADFAEDNSLADNKVTITL